MTMTIAQITLTDTAAQALSELARQSGKTRDDLLREAVEQFLTRHRTPDRLGLLRQGRGLWKDRADLPSLQDLRAEMDRGSSR
jgi:predicted transcriptional regulator